MMLLYQHIGNVKGRYTVTLRGVGSLRGAFVMVKRRGHNSVSVQFFISEVNNVF